MRFDLNRIYKLLPAIHRTKDALEGLEMLGKNPEEWDDNIYGPLKALLALIADEAVAIEENIDQLYDDMFIETCNEWVVPYIGDLIGYRRLTKIKDEQFSARSEVANTISYRRRKGTLSIIEQLAHDVTGWKASVKEYFKYLATSQYMNHVRPSHLAVSRINALLSNDGKIDLDSIDPNDLNLKYWKELQLVNWEQLQLVNTPFDRMPKSIDVRNIRSNRGQYNIQNIGIFLWRINSYAVTNRIPFSVDNKRYKFDVFGKDIQLYNRRDSELSISTLAERKNISMPLTRREVHDKKSKYYGFGQSIHIIDDGTPVPESQIRVCCLGDVNGDWINIPTTSNIVAIDPKLGRIAFGQDIDPKKIMVSYCYGFSKDMGGGEYERENRIDLPVPHIVLDHNSLNPNSFQPKLATYLSGNYDALEIKNNTAYKKSTTASAVNKSIHIGAQNENCAAIKCTNNWIFNCNETIGDPLEITLDGLNIDAEEIIVDGTLTKLTIRHCTLNPLKTILRINSNIKVVIEDSILGKIILPSSGSIDIRNSIVDGSSVSEMAISNAGKLSIENSTVIGGVSATLFELASNTIIYCDDKTVSVTAERTQQGCVRFSYIPKDSVLPSPFKCLPDTENTELLPQFETLKYGSAHYCMLTDCNPKILSGADDESEMGVYHDLYQNQKIGNLRTRLDEYLRFGLEVGIFFGS